ncbi:MAG TPA: alpha/beta hydrolase [Hyphomonadaceae bacterium]|nr:alpha/beta hydrolase [Hyphomonadaceae bacterium]
MKSPQASAPPKQTGYAPVNGLRMHYEITGAGDPIIYVPAAFAFAGLTEFPELARRWRVIQVDLQGHGRTADIDRPLSIEQHANDVVALMRHLKIERAHFLGWSYGGLIAMHIAMRHPELVDRIATYGALYGPPNEAIRPDKFGAPTEDSADGPAHQFAREAYMRVAPDPGHWPIIWKKLVSMVPETLSRDQIASIKNRVLIALGDNDFIRLEHALYAYAAIPNAELAVIPDATHFLPYDRPDKLEPVLAEFFAAPEKRPPLSTIATGYHPGKYR